MLLSWQRGIGAVVLSALAVLPVSGTVCAALCVPAANAQSVSDEHHAKVRPCHEPVSGQPQVQGTSGHDCDPHNGPAPEVTAALTAARVDLSVLSFSHPVPAATPNILALTSVRVHSGSSPPGPASSTRAPLVLRI